MATSEIALRGKIVVVTGGSRGIGEAIARACARAGAAVAIAARKLPELERVAAEIAREGGRALPVACHAGRADELEALFARVEAELGPADGLVNNAATNPHFGPLIECSEAAFDKTFETNARGYWNAARVFVARRRARSLAGGAIVNLASVAGLRAAPMQGVYGMSKAAVISMTQTLASELGSSGIRVNAIAPGLVETRFAAAIVGNPLLREHLVQRTPLARHAQPVEIAGAAVYLLSDAASFVSGTTLVVDGGVTSV